MPRTGVSAPLSTPGGATTRFWMSTLMLHGIYPFKKMSPFSHQRDKNSESEITYFNRPFRKCVKETIIEKFAGPYDSGVYSPSVQKTLYETQCLVLDRVPEVSPHFRS